MAETSNLVAAASTHTKGVYIRDAVSDAIWLLALDAPPAL
jgi:hypothetical protein